MAQMMHMLNYVSYNGKESGFHACLKAKYGYDYTLKMMLEEVRVLSKLEARDVESFNERSHFFTKDVVVNVLYDYVEKLKDYVDSLPTKKCKGVPYKRVKGKNIFVEDLDKKLYRPMIDKIERIEYVHNYADMYKHFKAFMWLAIKLPYNTPKSKVWIDAFKGEGAYYTMRNLCCFHSCKIYKDCVAYEGTAAVKYLNSLLDRYAGYKFFALMKKVIDDNNFNFEKVMREIYSEQDN